MKRLGCLIDVIQRVSRCEVQPELFGMLDEEPVAGEPADDALDETVEQALQGFDIRRTDAMESWSVGMLGVDAGENEHVQPATPPDSILMTIWETTR